MQTTIQTAVPGTTWPAYSALSSQTADCFVCEGAPRHTVGPEHFDVSDFANKSSGELAGWKNQLLLVSHNPLLACDPLPVLNQHVLQGVKVVVLTALTATAPVGQWLQPDHQPATAQQWDNPASVLKSHPTMSSPKVLELRRALPQADVLAIRDMYDLTEQFFGDVDNLEREYSFHRDYDTGEPVLFLTLRTHGNLDVDQLLEREMNLFAAVDKQPVLKAVQAYHVVTAV